MYFNNNNKEKNDEWTLIYLIICHSYSCWNDLTWRAVGNLLAEQLFNWLNMMQLPLCIWASIANFSALQFCCFLFYNFQIYCQRKEKNVNEEGNGEKKLASASLIIIFHSKMVFSVEAQNCSCSILYSKECQIKSNADEMLWQKTEVILLGCVFKCGMYSGKNKTEQWHTNEF